MDLAENLAPCTHPEGGACSIFGQLNDINSILRQTKLELRETSPGTLSLTQAPHLRRDAMSAPSHWVWHLLDAVLQQHHCVISICIDERKEPTGIPLDIISRKVPSLAMLRLRAIASNNNKGLLSLVAALSSGHRLQSLRLEAILLNSECVRQLSRYFSTTVTLETLSLGHTHVDAGVAEQLLMALEQNSTIRTLLLSTCLCYRGAFMGHGNQLAACVRNMASLQTLILDRCCFDCVPGLRVIMDALRCTRRLVTLNLIGYTGTKAFSEKMPLIMAENINLRSLKIAPPEDGRELCQCYLNYKCASCEVDYTENVGNIASLADGIQHNKWIELLTVDLSKSTIQECWNFFQALRLNSTLRKVTVVGLRSQDAASIHQMIRDCGILDRIFLQCPFNIQEPVEAVMKCKKLSSICIDAVQLEYGELLRKSLTLLPFWGHVTEVYLSLSPGVLLKEHALLVRYLEGATKLRNLILLIHKPVTILDVRHKVLAALFGNASIRKLHIDNGLVTNTEETLELASVLCANNRLHEFALFCDSELSLIDDLLRSLALGLHTNHTLCWIHHTPVYYTPQYNAVQDVLRRNRATSMCATHFVVGTKRTQRCAEAFHYVSNTPGLLDYVMQTASIGEAQAAYSIRRAFSKNVQAERYP
ncbi:hypothetical protein HPB50_027152 [Hyalomma asiaticum]|uniref:Uncharacterized protein n=1 Tax=Hyalomma asiaticum TaxID=266040 RepID=A0ACB7TQ44_HYAAI|nr:hypothetical protein HPB50_027152 [Hyalomma asiaticum]